MKKREEKKECPNTSPSVEPAEEESTGDESTWAHDQQNRDYYYDDSTGYEIYNPDEDDEEE